MGEPMLRALRDAGTGATGFDIAPKDVGWIGSDPGAFAQDLETLFVVVRDDFQIRSLLFDQEKIVAQADKLGRIVLCSTVSPRTVWEVHQSLPPHITLIDAPISGARVAAENRSLTFMLGGTHEDIDDLTPLLGVMGTHFYHMGGLGAGMQAKVLNNLLAASNTAMTRLVLEWAKDAALDEDRLLQLIDRSSGQNWFASGLDAIEFANDGHAPDNTIGTLVKDVAAAIDVSPQGADLALPQCVMTHLRNLKRR